MHSDEELIDAHRRVVENFRRNRTVSPAGLASWTRINRPHALTEYVLSEIDHHVRNAVVRENLASDPLVLSWLQEGCQDVICEAVARALGSTVLRDAALEAEAAGDWWAAACRWGALSTLMMSIEGREQSQPSGRRAVDAIAKIDLEVVTDCTLDMKDQLELDQLRNLLMGINEDDINKYIHRTEYLLPSKVCLRSPEDGFIMMMMSQVMVPMLNVELEAIGTHTISSMAYLKNRGIAASVDRANMKFCIGVLCGMFGWFANCCIVLPEWHWDDFTDALDQGPSAYEYDKHHLEFVAWANNDMYLAGPGPLHSLALHQGDLENANHQIEVSLAGLRRAAVEPDLGAEAFTLAACTAGDNFLFM
jgi:hypothetical protein